VARNLKTFEDTSPCSYLEGREATLEHQVALEVTPEELDLLFERGWRRFGPDYFRPRCAACSACVPTRLPVDLFLPNKSQRRAAKHSYRSEFAVPTVDEARLSLYRKWHETREEARGWNPSGMSERAYASTFSFPHPSARELSFWDGDTLIGVSIFDETPSALSAAYFYYDPDYQKQSLGTANVMALLAYAQKTGKKHVYLGFHVAACASLAYKGRFNPREILLGKPSFDAAPVWAACP
jgi:leucyl-tRNA---protein transferase